MSSSTTSTSTPAPPAKKYCRTCGRLISRTQPHFLTRKDCSQSCRRTRLTALDAALEHAIACTAVERARTPLLLTPKKGGGSSSSKKNKPQKCKFVEPGEIERLLRRKFDEERARRAEQRSELMQGDGEGREVEGEGREGREEDGEEEREIESVSEDEGGVRLDARLDVRDEDEDEDEVQGGEELSEQQKQEAGALAAQWRERVRRAARRVVAFGYPAAYLGGEGGAAGAAGKDGSLDASAVDGERYEFDCVQRGAVVEASFAKGEFGVQLKS